MAATSHGHHIPGTTTDPTESLITTKARCGGPTHCRQCSSETNNHLKQQFIQGPLTYENTEINQYADYQEEAKRYVVSYFRQMMERGDTTTRIPITEKEVYIVWFCKVLRNWKALLGTMNPDGMYYEVTYNGAENVVYFDAYKKIEHYVLRASG